MPSSFELGAAVRVREVMALKALRQTSDRLGLKLLPIQDRDEDDLVYERHRLMRGLQGARGLGGSTTPATLPGFDSFRVAPGYYGDHFLITEKDLVQRRKVGSWEEFDNDNSLTNRATTLLDVRYYDRIEKNVFDLLQTGSYEVTDVNGNVSMRDVYDIQTGSSAVAWSTVATATPLKDLRGLLNTLQSGKSVNFSDGKMYMQTATLNNLLNNQNASDFGGRRSAYGSTLNNLDDFNEFLKKDGLPTIETYDEGYYPEPEGTAFSKFLTDGKVVLVGKRKDGEQVGEYTQTRAAQNKNSGPGMWVTVRDERDRGNARIIIEAGHNGGPRIYYPEAICAFTAY